MNENLFTFPGGTADQSSDNPFDLSGFTELTGNDASNPFADLLAESKAADQPLTGPAGAVPTDKAPEEKPGTAEPPKTAEQSESHETSVPPAPEVPQPKTPPAPKSEGRPSTDTLEETEENPLLAAMDLQEEKNAQKAAEPIFAQLPVFSYNGAEEPIENTEQTFDELRLSKLEDFPEFEEAQSISWKVVYGKISKDVPLPRKTKIGQLKREIETSKEFINALKKATDKHPKCLVKPTVNMQKKGKASAYKGAFLHLAEAQASYKTITFIPGRDGKVYERRITGAGEFVTPTEHISILDAIHPGFHSALPLIPYALMEQAMSLFRAMMHRGKGRRPAEALVHIYWDKQEQRYFIHVPQQIANAATVHALLEDVTLMTSDRYLHYADLHSHNRMPAVFSETDDRDEKATRIYMVVGRLDRYFPEITVRISNGGRFWEIAPEQVLEMPPVGEFPPEWLTRIQTDADCFLEAAA